MEEYFVFAAYLSDLTDGLHDADLVVDMDDGADKGVGSNGISEHVEIDETICCHGKICDLEPLVFKLAARI